MAKGINKVILVGNLGNDPDVRYMPNGAAVANVSIATADSWMDKASGQRQERTEWHRVVFFNKLAEIVGEYLRKGSQVYVEGRLQTRKWSKDGIDRFSTEIVASDMQMLGGRPTDGRSGPAGASAVSQQSNGYPQARGREAANLPPSDADFDDDIPF